MPQYVRQQQTGTGTGGIGTGGTTGAGGGSSTLVQRRRKISRLPRQQSAPADLVDDDATVVDLLANGNGGGRGVHFSDALSATLDGGFSLKSIGSFLWKFFYLSVPLFMFLQNVFYVFYFLFIKYLILDMEFFLIINTFFYIFLIYNFFLVFLFI
jgi:hypothetical protein